MDEKIIKEIFSDEKYMKSLLEMHSYEEVQKSLERKNINLTIGELRKIHSLLVKRANGELTDKNLEEVSGGFASEVVIAIVAIAATACAPGAAWLVTLPSRKC